MRAFTLQDEFNDQSAERALVAAVSMNPDILRALAPIPNDAFSCEAEAWQRLSNAVAKGERLPAFQNWKPAEQPEAVLERLRDLMARRTITKILEEVGRGLYEPDQPADQLLVQAEALLARAQVARAQRGLGRLIRALEILPIVMQHAEERERIRKQTGKAIIGVETGIQKLDAVLSGLNPGRHVLAGGPGVGKTTLSLQIAGVASVSVPVLFVTFENSPENLVLKAIVSRAGINTRDVERGTADLGKVANAAVNWVQSIANRLAFRAGTSSLSVGHLRCDVRHLVRLHKTPTCLVIVDFLQLWAKVAVGYRGLDTVRARVEALAADLRELAIEMRCPILAIASQNREQGDTATV